MLTNEMIIKMNEMVEAFEQKTGYKLNKTRHDGFIREMDAIVESVGSLDSTTYKNLLKSSYKNMYATLLEDTLTSSLSTDTNMVEGLEIDFDNLMKKTFDLVIESKTVSVDNFTAPSKTNDEINDIHFEVLDKGFTNEVKNVLDSLNNEDLKKLCGKQDNLIYQIEEARKNGSVEKDWGEEKLQMHKQALKEMNSMLEKRLATSKTVKDAYDIKAPAFGGLTQKKIQKIQDNVENYAHNLTTAKLNVSVDELKALADAEFNKHANDNTYFKKVENCEKLGAIYNTLSERFSNRNIFSKLFHLNEYFAKNAILKNMMETLHLEKASVMNLFANSEDSTYTAKVEDTFKITEAMNDALTAQNEAKVEDLNKLTSIESDEVNNDLAPDSNIIIDKDELHM